MVNEPVDGSDSHCLIQKNGIPTAEWLVGGDHDGAPFVSGRDEFEQDAGLCLVLADVGQVIEDEQVEAVEPGDLLGQGQGLTCGLQTLDEIGGSGEEDPVSARDELVADGGCGVALAGTGRTKCQKVTSKNRPSLTG